MHIKIKIEVTDLFCGAANYSWVQRYQIPFRPNETRRARVRRVKSVIGWSGIRADVMDYGNLLDIRPRNATIVAFVTVEESNHE